ncbi:MAG: hypothetical protein ABS882_13795 [Lysinibacillus sp.]
MKQITTITVKIALITICCLVLTGCIDRLKAKATLTGTVEEVFSPTGFKLAIEEAHNTKLAGTIEVHVKEKNPVSVEAGDIVTVAFDGGVFESSPTFIQAITVEKVE